MAFQQEDADTFVAHIRCLHSQKTPKVLADIPLVGYEDGKTVYQLRLSLLHTDLEWTVTRRYSDFLRLRNVLLAYFTEHGMRQCFGCRWFLDSLRGYKFPRKHLLRSRAPRVIHNRMRHLDQFAHTLASHAFSAIPKCVTCSQTPFDYVCDFFTDDACLPPRIPFDRLRKALVPEKFAVIVDPNKSKIEFRRGLLIIGALQLEKCIRKSYEEEYDADLHELQLRRRVGSFYSMRGKYETTDVAHSRQTTRTLDTDVDEESDLTTTDSTDPVRLVL